MNELFKNKKFLLAIFTFILASISLISTTYAWFSISDTLRVTNIEIGTRDPSKFEIGLRNNSTDSVDFYQNISQSDLISHNQYSDNPVLYGVSSMYESSWLNNTTDLTSTTLLPTFRSLSATNVKEGMVASTGYYSLELYFYANADMYIFLSDTTSVKADSEKNAQTAAKNSLDVNDLNKIENSLRLSFLTPERYVKYEPNVLTSTKTKLANRLDVIKDGYYDVKNNNETVYGEYSNDDKIVYSEDARVKALTGTANAFNALSRDNVNCFDMEKSIANGLDIATESTYTLGELSDQSDIKHSLFTLSAYHKTRVVVTIYDEGWDIDHTELISSSAFNINLVFSAKLKR